jgi:hypothetical protein
MAAMSFELFQVSPHDDLAAFGSDVVLDISVAQSEWNECGVVGVGLDLLCS